MRYRELEHKVTLKRILIDTYMSRYRRLAMGFLNKLNGKRVFYKHITLTQAVESYHPNILNSFFVQLRRFYSDVSYLWTVEVQEARAERTGERVLHWHVIVAFERYIDFGREDVIRLQRYWKYGNMDVKPVQKCSFKYLMKYMTKALDIGVGAQIRRIGSSFIAGYYRMSWKRFLGVTQWFSDHSVDVLNMGLLKWTYRGASISFVDDDVGRRTVWIYRHPPSEWRLVVDVAF